jgi:hypothetical protein
MSLHEKPHLRLANRGSEPPLPLVKPRVIARQPTSIYYQVGDIKTCLRAFRELRQYPEGARVISIAEKSNDFIFEGTGPISFYDPSTKQAVTVLSAENILRFDQDSHPLKTVLTILGLKTFFFNNANLRIEVYSNTL